LDDQKSRVKQHYGRWAGTYGDSADDGWFAWVRAREARLVYRALDLRAGISVLDVGCGPGIHAKAIQERGHEVWAVDFAPEMVARARTRLHHVEQADVEDLSLGRSFDRVLCLGVLEWVRSPENALRRLAQHLAPGGRLVILVPRTGPGGWMYEHQKQKHQLRPRLYGAREMRRLGEAVGLQYHEQIAPAPHNFIMVFTAPRAPAPETIPSLEHRPLAAPRALRAALFAPYLALFYPYLALRRASAALRPAHGGAWRTWITPRLLVGGFLYPSDATTLAREGVGAVVNVSRELIDPRAALEDAGISYLRVPCWDASAPALPDADRGVRFIAEHVGEGRKVYIHCASGVGRSVSLTLCYLCAHEGAALDDALVAITRLRPRVALNRVQRAFIDDYLAFRRAAPGVCSDHVP
jgi:SAM-dependent methyltransferase